MPWRRATNILPPAWTITSASRASRRSGGKARSIAGAKAGPERRVAPPPPDAPLARCAQPRRSDGGGIDRKTIGFVEVFLDTAAERADGGFLCRRRQTIGNAAGRRPFARQHGGPFGAMRLSALARQLKRPAERRFAKRPAPLADRLQTVGLGTAAALSDWIAKRRARMPQSVRTRAIEPIVPRLPTAVIPPSAPKRESS